MLALVTGAAGFIGSSIADALLQSRFKVRGIDNYLPYYKREIKERNIQSAVRNPNFTMLEEDLRECDLNQLLDGVTHIFHQAGQPGVRSSWGIDFAEYVSCNVLATQRLLHAAKDLTSLKSFVAASSSSIYGRAEAFPTLEGSVPHPISPYGVTKLAAENLVSLYGFEFGLPTASLRYFTVYGPRQRPDMAISKLIHAAYGGSDFVVHGSGQQVRDFTFVSDVVSANLLASRELETRGKSIPPLNIGGGSPVSLVDLIEIIEQVTSRKIHLRHVPSPVGDPEQTGADNSLAARVLGWSPRIGICEGIEAHVRWFENV
jgi:UDP-glucuronate 4-epimerase